MKLKLSYLIGSAVLVAPIVPAHAATLLFSLTGSRNATFQLDSTRAPDYSSSSSLIGSQISYDNVVGIFGGAPATASSVSFGTYLISSFQINGTSLGFTQFAGPDLFTGAATAPAFKLGTFTLNNFIFGPSTLTISQAAAAVPEPATWAMMIAGFGLLGGAMRYRRRKSRISWA